MRRKLKLGVVALTLVATTPLLGGCSDGERIATGAAIGALAGVALGSLDDSDVRVRGYTYYGSYGRGWDCYDRGGFDYGWGWSGDPRFGRHHGTWRSRSYPNRSWGGGRGSYRCDY